jgi:uncharacterized SAM-binding protein YcdF (DUF218 family)
MITATFFFLFIFLGIFFSLKYYSASRAVYLFSFLYFWLIGSGWLLAELLANIQSLSSPSVSLSSISWGKNNALILLGGGISKTEKEEEFSPAMGAYGRIFTALKFYTACRRETNATCLLFITGGDPKRRGKSEAAVYAEHLRDVGIRKEDLILDEKSNNTYQNAEFTSKLIKKQGSDTIILISSSTHLPRSLLYFSHFGIKAIPVAGDSVSPQLSWIPKSYNFLLADLIIHEHIGTIRYHIYTFFGWNKKPEAASETE